MNGLLIIFLLIFVSGLIAYLGDQIGMKMGKKRLSLFGLRPKYSSIIITVITGILIATLSITILLTTYSGLRQALFNINEVLDRLSTLNHQLSLKDGELKVMKEEIDTKIEELNRLQEQKKELGLKLALTQEEVDRAKQDLRLAQDDINVLVESKKTLEDRINSLKTQRDDLEGKIEDLNHQIASVTSDYEQAKELASQYQAGIKYFINEDIVYQKGDLIYSDVLEGGQSEEETIEALYSFLQRANDVAKQRPIMVKKDTGMALMLQEEDIFNTARILYNMDPGEKVIVRLAARINVPRNEWLYANFLYNKDFIVFNKGSKIAEKTIDASQQAADIERELKELLYLVNKNAIQKGLLPDTQGQVGSLNFSQFYQLLKQIQSLQGRVDVQVYALEDIWRSDRLTANLNFEIKAGGE